MRTPSLPESCAPDLPEAAPAHPADTPSPPANAPIALTMGDASGIGPEIVLRFLATQTLAARADFCVYGDLAILQREANHLDLRAALDGVRIENCSQLPKDLAYARVDARAGAAAAAAITRAAEDALQGRVRGLVTAPIHKAAFAAAGIPYPGHTELLGALAGTTEVRMMLANDELRTVLVTIHLALRDAIAALSQERVFKTICITASALQRAGLPTARIAVAGLNPHAGEGGLFGREEIETITPAIAQARAHGIDASGPWAPDTVFMRARGFREFDAVVAMVHDHGLIPIKYLGLDAGVNATLGLPFVRTSPDHGTAFDIAGRGCADPRSFSAAVQMAAALTPTVAAPTRSEPA